MNITDDQISRPRLIAMIAKILASQNPCVVIGFTYLNGKALVVGDIPTRVAVNDKFIQQLGEYFKEVLDSMKIDNDNLPERLNRLQRKWEGGVVGNIIKNPDGGVEVKFN
jgi:hypothetical protein